MTTHYEVLRPITPADLHTCSTYVEILKSLPLHGYATFEMFRHIDKTGSTRCMAYACSRGILKRISPHERILKLDSVKFWVTQLNKSGHKNSVSKHGTRPLYLQGLSRFDEWLPGRSFQSHETVVAGGQITKKAVTKSFANVEELLHYCIESGYGTKAAQRAIREYLVSPQVDKMSDSLYMSTRSAIKSYFSINDQALDLPRTRKKRADLTTDNKPSMSLEDFYKMLQNGKPGIMMRTIMLVKFHSGMDSSTLTDRFNYEGYSQIVRYFKTDDHAMWNLDLCPVPIRLVRVKTGVQYTTFLEHDAIAQLQEYLTWKEMKYDKQDPLKPLFMTKQKTPISSLWLSRSFSKVAVQAGVQKKISRRTYKITAHEVRDLLKSTLLMCGCKQYAAEHVLGHAPKDSYEKQAVLYPEQLRAEYAKASPYINIFSKVESTLNTTDDPASLLARIKELEAQAAETGTVNAEIALLERRHQKSMQKMYDAIESLKEQISSIQRHDDE